jgi:hypothetical protein
MICPIFRLAFLFAKAAQSMPQDDCEIPFEFDATYRAN